MNNTQRPVLEVRSVALRFGGIVALNDITFGLAEGEWLGLIGPNGSGKTSCLNVLSGFYVPTKGQIWYNRRDLAGLKPHAKQRHGIVRTFQHPVLANRLSLLDNVLLATNYNKNYNKMRSSGKYETKMSELSARTLLEKFGCVVYAYRAAREAPYGVQKRAEIARALLAKPSVLLLDEPAAGLSQGERTELVDALIGVRKEFCDLSVIVVEHDVQFITELCPRAVALNFGNVIANDKIDEVLRNGNVASAFLGEK